MSAISRILALGACAAGLAGCPAPPDDAPDGAPPSPAPAAEAPRADPALAAAAGTLGCTASRYDASSQSYSFDPRGSVVLEVDGGYAYRGFEEPSRGTFEVDDGGAARFRGGHLDGGELTPMEDRPGRFYLVFPANPENRWTCSRTDGEG